MKKFKNKKILFSFIILFVVGLAFGMLFIIFISNSDSTLIKKEINEYFILIKDNHSYLKGIINSLKTNLLYITIIWGIGLIPFMFLINYFIVFYKGFLIGFMFSSIIMIYKLKGILISILFLFPHEYINVFLIVTLSVISLKFSRKMYFKIKNNNLYNFNKHYKEYLKIYALFTLLSIISTLFEIFINSFFIKLVV